MNKSQLTEALAKAENITLKKAEMVVNASSVRLGFCMSVILLLPGVGGVIIQNPSLILDVDA